MATYNFDGDHLKGFNDLYLYIAEKMEHQHVKKDLTKKTDEGYFADFTAYSDEIVEFYKSHNMYDNILEKGNAKYVIALLAPPGKVHDKISYDTSKILFHNTIVTIARDKGLTYRETAKIYHDKIQHLDEDINNHTQEEILAAYNDSIDLKHQEASSVAVENEGKEHEEMKDQRTVTPPSVAEEQLHDQVPTSADRPVREEPREERPHLNKDMTHRIITYHMSSFGIKNSDSFRKIMEGKSIGLFVVSILVGLALLSLMVIFRNVLAFGDNFVAQGLQTTGDALNTSPMIILLFIFFILLLIILFAVFRFARFYEKRKLFLRNTPLLIKALDVNEQTFNEIIDEEFYDEKVDLRKRTFSS